MYLERVLDLAIKLTSADETRAPRHVHDEPEDAVDGVGGESVFIDMKSVNATIAASPASSSLQAAIPRGPRT